MALYSDEGLAKPGARRTPEGTSRKARAKALVFMAIALIAGLSAAWLINLYLQRGPAVASQMTTTRIAVAATDLPIATTIKPEMISLVDWPAGSKPKGSFGDAKLLEGRVTSVALVKGEPLVEARLAGKEAGQGMAAIIASNMRAMTVRVNEVIGVAGFIHPGDYVDVITTMQTPTRPNATEQQYRSKIVLQNIKVLAVGEDLVTQNAKPVKVPVVTLLVTPEQSERLALSSSHGEVQLTMRSQADQLQVETPGVSPIELFAEMGAPAGAASSSDRKSSSSRSGRSTRVATVTPTLQEPPKKEAEVVEILRGDKFEERKMRAKESP